MQILHFLDYSVKASLKLIAFEENQLFVLHRSRFYEIIVLHFVLVFLNCCFHFYLVALFLQMFSCFKPHWDPVQCVISFSYQLTFLMLQQCMDFYNTYVTQYFRQGSFKPINTSTDLPIHRISVLQLLFSYLKLHHFPISCSHASIF